MALYIKDQTVDDLATQYQVMTGAKSKTEAVRQALEIGIQHLPKQQTLESRLADAFAIVNAMGPKDPNFDEKAYMDEMWGD